MHGGIPEGLESLSDINGLDCEVDPEDRITFQILWNDPVENNGGFFNNSRGGYSRRFGREAFQYFIEKHNIKLVLRAHEVHKGGYKPFFQEQLISLDTSDTPKKKNKYKVFIVENTGEWRIAEVEAFETVDISKILSNKAL
jgi:diadenosine tetraphosphatase ApaH/serine/threonine PP2A family protein phosphatase